MTPGQRHAVLAGAALIPFAVYEAVEIKQGDEGWPYSRWLRLLPGWLFIGIVAAFNSWFVPHILRRAARSVATAAVDAIDAIDQSRPTFDTEE